MSARRGSSKGISFLKEGTGEEYNANTQRSNPPTASTRTPEKSIEDKNILAPQWVGAKDEASLRQSYLASARDKLKTSKGYFDESEDEDDKVLAIPSENEDESYDPLDAFMEGVEKAVKEEEKTAGKEKSKPDFLDEAHENERIPEEDWNIDQSEAGPSENLLLDSDGYPIGRVPEEKKIIEALPPINHANMQYEAFKKSFYTPVADIANMFPSQVISLREELQIAVEGRNVPSPIRSFTQAGFSDELLSEIIRQGLEAPTPIQSQALPVAMSGRDLIGVAQTGSGKTFAFIWPMLVHIMDQREIEVGEGPISVILSPTRELAGQIYGEARKFAKKLGIKVCAVFGGAGKWEMQKALKEGPEVVVATPGRLIEMIKTKATNLQRCTCIILDEADRMFDLGFGYQMRSIVDQVRPDRQTMLFSATFKRKVEQLARDVLTDPIRINVGSAGAMTANQDIDQIVHVFAHDTAKWVWLASQLPGFLSIGKVLIFVSSKAGCDELCKSIKSHMKSIAVGAIHGDKDQMDREMTLRQFRQSEINVLVATDVASRGLDIKDVNTVVSFDMAKNIETHIHRIGRTGRMSKEGVNPGAAHTLFTPKQSHLAPDLIKHLQASNQPVPAALENLQGGNYGRGRGGIGHSSSIRGVAIAPPNSYTKIPSSSERDKVSSPTGGDRGKHHLFSDQELEMQIRAPWSPPCASPAPEIIGLSVSISDEVESESNNRVRKKSRWGPEK